MDPSRPLPVGKCILAVVLAVAGFFYYDLGRYLSFEALKNHRLVLVEANYGTAVAAFIISYALITGVSLPGAAIMTLAGGFLFEIVPGTFVYAYAGRRLGGLNSMPILRHRECLWRSRCWACWRRSSTGGCDSESSKRE